MTSTCFLTCHASLAILPIYKESLSLLTDFYELTMAYSYWKVGIANRKAMFSMFLREHPFQGGCTVAANL